MIKSPLSHASISGKKHPVATLLALSLSLVSATAANFTWNGNTSASIALNGNWVGGLAPVLTNASSIDILEFTGNSAPLNQPTWTGAASNSLGGLITGNDYAATLTFNANSANRVIDFGAGGITTGSTLFTLTGTQSGATQRNVGLQINTNQTWNIGSGGMLVNNTGTANVQLTGSGTLTKAGTGNLTWSAGNNTLTALTITSGGVISTSPGIRFVTNAVGGLITLDGPTALIRQSAAIGNTTIQINGGGTFQTLNGSQNWANNGQFSGTGAFTLDTTLQASSGVGQSISGDNSGYTGHLTLTTGGGTGFNRVTALNVNALGGGTNSNHQLTINATDTNTSLAIGAVATANNLTVGTLNGNSSARIVASATSASAVTVLTVNQFLSGTYAGTFANSGSGSLQLVKNEAGTLALGGSSSSWAKGAVTVNAGTMLIRADNALGASQVTVALNNAILASDVTGRILTNTVTTAGATSIIEPTGTFTFGGLNATAGTTLDLDSGEILSMTNSFTGASAGGFVLDLSAGFTTGSPVTIITFGTQTGVDSSDFVLSAAASSLYTLNSVTVDGDSVDITLSVIPEPAACVLLVGGLATTFFARRRRTA